MQDLSVALLQADLAWEDKAANLEMFEQRLAALPGHVRLAVLPEMFSTGFSMKPEQTADPMDGKGPEAIRRWARQYGKAVTGSLVIEEGGRYFNRMFFVTPEGEEYTYDKKHLFSMAGEHKHYQPGQAKRILSYAGCKICPMVCYDLRFPVWIRNQEGYEVSIFVANWPEVRVAQWRTLLRARAIENQVYVLGVNRVGKDGNDVYHSGYSAVISPNGDLLQEAAHDEATLLHTLSAHQLERLRRHKSFLKDMDAFQLLEPKTAG
jgi:predicted amidohydrolase